MMGHEVVQEERKFEDYDENPESEGYLRELFLREHFDFVFTVNYFALISRVCEERHLPYVIWTCDNPLISMYHESVFYDCNYIFTFDKTNYLEFKGMGVKHIYYLPLCVDAKRCETLIAEANDLCCYHNEVAFVGSLYERNSYDRLRPALPDYLQGYFEAVMEAQMNISGGNIVERLLTPDILMDLEQYFHLEKSAGSFSDLGLIFSTTVLGFKIAAIQRRKALIQLSTHYPVKIYSNSDVSDLIKVEYGGSVDYWSQMPKVFHESKINLNFTIPNIKSGIPLRVWDVLGAGGFLLTNFQAELPAYFENKKDLVWFEDQEELLELTGYYLSHEEERREIAQKGFEKVKKYHSYHQRIENLMNIITNELSIY